MLGYNSAWGLVYPGSLARLQYQTIFKLTCMSTLKKEGTRAALASGLVAALISRACNYMYSPLPVQPGHDQVHSWYKMDARMVGWVGVVQVSGQ